MKRTKRTNETSARERLRLDAVRLVEAGATQSGVAGKLGVSRQAVSVWVRKYRAGGASALRDAPRGPRHGWIGETGRDCVFSQLVDTYPDAAKLPGALWTPRSMGLLVERCTGRKFRSDTVRQYLRRWGLEPPRPSRRTEHLNMPLVGSWLRSVWPEFRRQARDKDAALFWFSGVESGFDGPGSRSLHLLHAFDERGRLAYLAAHGERKTRHALEFLGRLRALHAGRGLWLAVCADLMRSARISSEITRSCDRFVTFPC